MADFARVDFPHDIKVRIDGGMTPIRAVYHHEVLMSFYDDDGAEGFREWWSDAGAAAFGAWMEGQDRA